MGNTLTAFSTPTPQVGVVQSNKLGCISKFPALEYKCTTLQHCPRVTVAPTGTQTQKLRKPEKIFQKTKILGACDSWHSGTRKLVQQLAEVIMYLATQTVANTNSPKVMHSKFLLFSLISLLSTIVFVGKFLNEQEELAYAKCMENRNHYNYCQVLVWGR